MAQCSLCKAEVDKSLLQTMGKEKYCRTCYPRMQKREKDRRELIGYICKVFDIKKPTGLMFAQMKNFNEKHNIDYKAMRLTIKYLHEEENFQFELKFGIAIVKYRYAEALNFYRRKAQAMRNVKTVQYKSNNITISLTHSENKFVKDNLIDIDSLIQGGEDDRGNKNRNQC